jgi:hypothetical protein
VRYLIAIAIASVVVSYVSVRFHLWPLTITIQALILVAVFVGFVALLAIRSRSRMSAAILVGAGILILVPYFVIVLAVSSYVVNNWRLDRFVAQFVDNPPEGARVTLQRRQVGILTGNGDHCDYVVDFQVQGALSAEAIVEHYRGLPVESAVVGESAEMGLSIEKVAEGRYRLNATDATYMSALDFRCI